MIVRFFRHFLSVAFIDGIYFLSEILTDFKQIFTSAFCAISRFSMRGVNDQCVRQLNIILPGNRNAFGNQSVHYGIILQPLFSELRQTRWINHIIFRRNTKKILEGHIRHSPGYNITIRQFIHPFQHQILEHNLRPVAGPPVIKRISVPKHFIDKGKIHEIIQLSQLVVFWNDNVIQSDIRTQNHTLTLYHFNSPDRFISFRNACLISSDFDCPD